MKLGKSATNQKLSSVAIKLQIMLQYFNQYISKHATFTLKVNTLSLQFYTFHSFTSARRAAGVSSMQTIGNH